MTRLLCVLVCLFTAAFSAACADGLTSPSRVPAIGQTIGALQAGDDFILPPAVLAPPECLTFDGLCQPPITPPECPLSLCAPPAPVPECQPLPPIDGLLMASWCAPAGTY